MVLFARMVLVDSFACVLLELACSMGRMQVAVFRCVVPEVSALALFDARVGCWDWGVPLVASPVHTP